MAIRSPLIVLRKLKIVPLFTNTVDEAGSHAYTMAGGAIEVLDDPMLMNGMLLNNNLQTFTANIPTTGAELTLVLDADQDAGSEAFAFDNIVINGDIAAIPTMGQWALLILAMLMSSFALGFMVSSRKSLVG